MSGLAAMIFRMRMMGFVAGAALACMAGVTGCSSGGNDPVTVVETRTVTAAPSTMGEAEGGRTPGNAIQMRLFVSAVNEMYESNNQPGVSEAEAAGLADSMCNFLDSGASTYDAKQLLDDEGYPSEFTSNIVATGIAAGCTEYLP